jgi:serine/threonine protein kinase
VIVIEFVGNGSLASHLPATQASDKCCLSGPNRIAQIIIGIARAMRSIHSRDSILRDLRPENMLLDWDWNVRIADFGHNISPDNPQPPSFFDVNPTGKWPSVDSLYLAPECYESSYFQESDMFSFGLILYQILTG